LFHEAGTGDIVHQNIDGAFSFFGEGEAVGAIVDDAADD
jgi:hypothetical protein